MADNAPGAAWIEAADEESYYVLPGRADAGVILLCDHAGNAFPPGYGTLGLPPEQLQRHIAYDIGAAGVTHGIAAALRIPAILTRYSRLLIDPNRGVDDPTLIMRLSDGAIVPGNRRLDAAERERRIRLYHEPYHRAVDRLIDRCMAAGPTPILLSMHSFTESWKTTPRPWHVGVLWDKVDGRFALPVLETLHAEGSLIVGDNEPYTGVLVGDCMWQHGAQRGLASALIEIRQDLIRDAAGQAGWAARFCRIVEKILGDILDPTRPLRGQGNTIDAVPARTNGGADMTKLDKALETELEAAAFRRLVQHMRTRSDVQNIDLMNLSGFCRNCLANWYQEAASERGLQLTKEGAREVIYGMPYKDWQAKHQKEASSEQQAAFKADKPHQH
jgi:predicted N-formylglutamate amidohydrolase